MVTTQEGISTVRTLSYLGHLYPSQLFLPPTALATEGVWGGGRQYGFGAFHVCP